MTTTTVDLQIVPLHNCTKCIRKIKRTLRGFDGVELLDVDHPENGKFTIETTKHPEEIRDALQRKFAGKSVKILSKRIINHSNPLSALINPRNSSIQGPLGFHDIAEALVAVSRANGSLNVEHTQSSTIRINFNNQPTTYGSATNVWDSEDGGYGYVNVPPPPSAPPLPPRYQPTTSGSTRRPENVWGSSGGGDVGYGCVPPPPPPPPPPPRRYQPTTSGSAWPSENVWGSGGAHNEDFGYGYVEPSDPLIPRAQAQGYVYGYPIELYGLSASGEDDYSCGCCSIL